MVEGFSGIGFAAPAFHAGVEDVGPARILVDGVDITDDVVIARTRFTMTASTTPGTSSIWVKDLGHTHSFSTGVEATLDIGEERVWGGFVMGIRYNFAFPADDTDTPSETERFIILECSDYNLLFAKRFVLNKADPSLDIPDYDAGQHDKQIVLDLVNDYLDLSTDDIHYNGVTHVGTPVEDEIGSIAVPGMAWGQSMKLISALPGAIFYIDSYKNLNYADVDIPDAPFGLSDQPDGVNTIGYGKMEILENGTTLGNDAMVWGTALGSDHMTFARKEDAASIALHGRWQWSDYQQKLYKPESVLKRATTYVDGSIQNKRGHKDPGISIKCRTRVPGLRAGMRVNFECHTFDFEDVIPIRSMTITFVSLTAPLFEMVLAHYIDEPWITSEMKILEEKSTRVCETAPQECGEVVLDPNALDDFARSVSGSETIHKLINNLSADGAARPSNVFTDKGSLITGMIPAVTLIHASYWQTNGFGYRPYRLNVSESPEFYDVGSGSLPMNPTGNDRRDYGARIAITRRFRGSSYPANLTQAGFWEADIPGATLSVHRDGNNVGFRTTTVQIQSGRVPDGGLTSWGLGPTVWAYTFGISEVGPVNTGDITWTPYLGSPEYMVTIAEGGVGVDQGAGEHYVEYMNDPVHKFNPPLALHDRWPNDLYSTYVSWFDILGHLHEAWFTNQASDGGGIDSSGTFEKLAVEYEEALGWGTGPTIDWDIKSCDGDDWSDFASVMSSYIGSPPILGGYGILRCHPNPITGIPGNSYVGTNTPHLGPFDYTFTLRMSIQNVAAGTYYNGTYVSVDIGTWFALYPDNKVLDFASFENIPLGMEPTVETKFHIQYDSGGSRLRWWQGDTEPSTWNLDDPTYDYFGTNEYFSVQMEVPTATMSNVLYMGAVYQVTCVTEDEVQLSQAFVPGTVVATVQETGEEVEIEEVEASSGKILFVDPPAPPTTMVCYNVPQAATGVVPVEGIDPPSGGSVYRPDHLRQLGWGTAFDGLNCTMASAAIALDRHTEGAKTSTPVIMRANQSDQSGGTDLGDAEDAWDNAYNENLNVQYGISWSTAVSMVNAGRGMILQGVYGQIPTKYSGQPSFNGPHAIYVNEFSSAGYGLTYDPLCRSPQWIPSSILQAYATAFGGGSVNAAFTQVT